MRVYSAAIAAATAWTVAVAQTTQTTQTTSTVPASSGSGTISATAGSVSCMFRYSMPTATNLPSSVTTTTSSTTSSGSDSDDETNTSSDMSGSVGDGSDDSPGTVGVGSDDSSDASTDTWSGEATQDTSSDTSGSSTPTSTTKTPTSTTKTPTSTTKTPTATTKTPAATTRTPSTSTGSTTSEGSADTTLATTAPSTETTLGSDDGRRLMGEAGGTPTTAGTAGVTATVSTEASGSTGTTSTATIVPTATTATPTTPTTAKTPTSTTKTPSTNTGTTTTATTAPTTTTGSSSMTGSAGVVRTTNSTTGTTTIEFSCDSTFYSAWSTIGLTCGGTELDVMSAAASTECLIYSGTSSGTEISNLATCMSVCRFPACNNGTWDYTASDGINSEIYAGLDFLTLMSYAGTKAAASVADAVQQPFSNLTFAATTECDYTSDNSFGSCQCAGVASSTPSSGAGGTGTSSSSQYSVPANKGLEDSDHWADGTAKSTVDKAGIASTTIGSSAATVSVVAGGVMSVASGVVGGTSAGVASGVSAAASVGITMAAVDICQFSIMLNQMNVDARPRFMENMGKQMAPAAFTFLSFGKNNATSSDDNSTSAGSGSSSYVDQSRRLVTGSSSSGSSGSGSSMSTTGVQGMEKYAYLIGVDPDMLFYLAVAGIACMVAVLFGAYTLAMGVCFFFVQDFPTFSKKWLDKAIGVLMMILILSEYVVGATAMYQICYCIDHDSIDVSFFLAILTLLGLAFGTILYGVLVIKNNEDELRDLGTKDHFDKKFHARYGPLYDEHSFEGRFFFAPKLLLALLCGMTTGMVWIEGLWQIIVLIAFHIAFLLYLEIKQPYPTAFVQKTSSFVIIIKISALFLSFFLLSSATSFTESIPDDLREGVAFAIVGLQVLVLVCLMIRQVYIFYRTWKLKRDGTDDKTVTVQTTNAREGSEAFFALGGEPQYYNNNQSRGGSMAVLGDDTTPKMQDPRQYAQETPSNANYYGNRPLRGLQPQGNNHMQRTHTVVQHENHHRSNEVDL